MKLQKEDGITDEEGLKVNVKVAKNRAAHDNPYKATSFTALYGVGIDKCRELADLSQEYGIATSGSWVYIGTSKEDTMEWKGEKIAINGKGKYVDFIRSDEDFQDWLLKEIRAKRTHKTLSNEEIEAIEQEEQALELSFGEE